MIKFKLTDQDEGNVIAGYENVTPETRRRMLAVRKRNTPPELRVRRVLHAIGYRYRLHRKDLPGTPDIVLPRHRKIVLVHGCFWHGHENCKKSKLPTNNAKTWAAKIKGNRLRDQRNIAALNTLGWEVLIIWECETRDTLCLEALLRDFFGNH